MQIKELIRENKTFIFKAFIVFLLAFLVAGSLHEGRYERNTGDSTQNVITVSGHGEINATPDIATIYFTVESSKGTQKDSSDEVNTKTKKVLDFLKGVGVADKDIKTDSYSSYPKYSTPEPCPVHITNTGIVPPCHQGESKIVGYTVSQSVTVKVRKVDDASKVIDGINQIGVMNMSGPTMSIDDENALKADARKKAIDDAKTKAEVLARDLGVRLGKLTSFNENSNAYPMYNGGASAIMLKDSFAPAVPSEIPKGENTIGSDVTITYEIR